MRPKAIVCWSGGKDSALALHKVLNEGSYDVIGLLTTFNREYRRVSMHGVREELVEKQAERIGLPLFKMYVQEGTNAEYEKSLKELLLSQKEKGLSHVVFGDIFLEDLRRYRESNLSEIGLKAVFPLWQEDTGKLMNEFLNAGFRTITCCISNALLKEEDVGVEITREFIASLPVDVDPCGENGEYHTFCFEGPVFSRPVHFSKGERIFRSIPAETGSDTTKGFWFCELKPQQE